jgi:hypothetical protein
MLYLLLSHSPGLAADRAGTLQRPTGGRVLVWHDAEAMRKGLAIIGTEGAPMLLLRPYLACTPPSGTQVVRQRSEGRTHTITVTGPSDVGCRGIVAQEFFSERPRR